MDDAIHRIQRLALKQDELCYRLLQEGRNLKDEVDTLRKTVALQETTPRDVDAAIERVPNTPVIKEKTSFGKLLSKFTSRLSRGSLQEGKEGTDSTASGSLAVERKVKVGLKAPDMAEGALNLRKKQKKEQSGFLEPRFRSATASLAVFAVDHPFRGEVRGIVENRMFSVVVSSFIILSACLIGIEIECEAQSIVYGAHDADSWWSLCTYTTSFAVMQVTVGVVFIFEVVARLIAYDKRFFGYGVGTVAKDWQWNLFDLICLIATCIDICYELFDGRDGRSIVSFIRQFRIIRVATTIRTARFAREFRKMSYALQYSGSTLIWAIITLFFVIFFFAAAFTQATTEHLRDRSRNSGVAYLETLEDAYGTLPMSMHSLFQAVAGGIDWSNIIDPLMNMNWIFPALFLFYIAATTFGVMNVITSVFVESAVASYHHYKEVLIQENLATRKLYVTHLKEIFNEVDYDNDGEISRDELERFLTDPFLQQYLESIDVHPNDATTLFKLLDKDASGYISIDEFCSGCLRLKGEAKSYDIHCMIYENERIMHKFQDLITFMENGLLAQVDQTVDKSLRKSMAAGHVLSGGGFARDHTLESLKERSERYIDPSYFPSSRSDISLSHLREGSGCLPSGPLTPTSRPGITFSDIQNAKHDRQKTLTPRGSSHNFTPAIHSIRTLRPNTPLPAVGQDVPASLD